MMPWSADFQRRHDAGTTGRQNGGAPQAAVPWHFLYFFPEPHGQGSLRPTFASLRFTVCGSVVPLEKYIGCCFGFGGAMDRCTRGACCCCSRSTTTSIFHRYLTTRS